MIPTGTVHIGRDPNSDMWLGAPHISRVHITVEFTKRGEVLITDNSTNGTALNGKLLKREVPFSTGDTPGVLDFGSDLTVAVCFNSDQEQMFRSQKGNSLTFAAANNVPISKKMSASHSSALRKKGKGENPVNFILRAFKSFSFGGKAFLVLMGFLLILVILALTVLLQGIFN